MVNPENSFNVLLQHSKNSIFYFSVVNGQLFFQSTYVETQNNVKWEKSKNQTKRFIIFAGSRCESKYSIEFAVSIFAT